MEKKNVFFSAVIIILIGVLFFLFLNRKGGEPKVSTKYDSFAQCLAAQKLTMYGATWCSHCQAQKAMFEDSFKYVPYVECTENPAECLKNGVEAYPTWIGANGEKYVGEQSLEKLGNITGCKLPAN